MTNKIHNIEKLIPGEIYSLYDHCATVFPGFNNIIFLFDDKEHNQLSFYNIENNTETLVVRSTLISFLKTKNYFAKVS